MRSEKRCIVCGNDLSFDSDRLCDFHLSVQANRSRRRYREANGIPLELENMRGKHLTREEGPNAKIDRSDSEGGTTDSNQ